MSGSLLDELARQVVAARAPALPTFLLMRDAELFEVEFEGLECAEETHLPASDWAVLALARALGEVSPNDVDAYLGLGDAVAEGLVSRIAEDGLLLERSGAGTRPPPAGGEAQGFGAYLRRLFNPGLTVGRHEVAGRQPTDARPLYVSQASSSPSYAIGPAGLRALECAAVVRRRVRPARALFLADPLYCVETVDERRQRFAKHFRVRPLDPEAVPGPLARIDEALSLEPDLRLAASGIGRNLPGLTGELIGVEAGKQWEVRAVLPPRNARQVSSGREHAVQETASIVVAGFPSTDTEGLRWHAYLGRQELAEAPGMDVGRLVPAEAMSLNGTIHRVDPTGTAGFDRGRLRPDGAFEVVRDSLSLPTSLGLADRPTDTYVHAGIIGDWSVGVRVHAVPADENAASAAFFDLLTRRDAELRTDFDACCRSTAQDLNNYWERDHDLPTSEDAARALWERPELRAALCMRRLHRDLVEPYRSRAIPA